jgi:hypothetical protein
MKQAPFASAAPTADARRLTFSLAPGVRGKAGSEAFQIGPARGARAPGRFAEALDAAEAKSAAPGDTGLPLRPQRARNTGLSPAAPIGAALGVDHTGPAERTRIEAPVSLAIPGALGM